MTSSSQHLLQGALVPPLECAGGLSGRQAAVDGPMRHLLGCSPLAQLSCPLHISFSPLCSGSFPLTFPVLLTPLGSPSVLSASVPHSVPLIFSDLSCSFISASGGGPCRGLLSISALPVPRGAIGASGFPLPPLMADSKVNPRVCGPPPLQALWLLPPRGFSLELLTHIWPNCCSS